MKRDSKKDAFLLWQFLVKAAKDRTFYTYSELQSFTGISVSAIKSALDKVYKYTSSEGLPPISILATRKETSSPGEGYPFSVPFPVLLANVQKYDWSTVPNPFIE